MELVPTLISTGWASGVNAYATVLVLGLLGRAGFGTELVPEQLTETPILVGAGVMYAIEFVTDKVPYVDNLWDLISTAVRPAIGSAIGLEYASADNLDGLDQALAGGGSGAIALISHGVKAGLRLGINASPEPFTNILASLDGGRTGGRCDGVCARAAGDRRRDRRPAPALRHRPRRLHLESDQACWSRCFAGVTARAAVHTR